MYFYAPWCSFCKALAPHFAAASSQLKALGNAAVMAKVDAVSTPGGEALAARFSVTSIPALIWFVNGRPQPYTQNPGNPQDSSDLVFWVVTQTDTITRTLTNQVCAAPCPFKGRTRQQSRSHCMQRLVLLAACLLLLLDL